MTAEKALNEVDKATEVIFEWRIPHFYLKNFDGMES